MIVRSAVFVKSALKPGDFPETTFPEIAFAGRSNVGKSSLINTLLGRKSLVRTSRTPGQTQLLNFFLINDNLMLVDLPGYGYSRAPKEVIRSYQQAMTEYLQFRKNLALLVLLLDIRRSPNEEDRYFFNLAAYLGIGPVVVLTKTDTISRGNWPAAQKEIARQLGWGPDRTPVFFSSKTRLGKDELWRVLEEGSERK
ncbi:MAG: YihA family ribosome biogenesis GTP-binding protein [Deltaproteobacteria bacterium]|nr:YihA family ribosome biogenesis GTP-binding protein [Deltaproteobacteria bacterium]